MNKKERLVDGKLVEAVQAGNHEALVTLVKRWHKIFCDRAYWLVKDADLAKDVAQDCWQIIIDKLDSLKEPGNFGSWALRIVYSKSIDAIKANNRREKVSNQLWQQQDDAVPTEESDKNALQQEVLHRINALPKHQQMVLRLFYVQEYSLKDIGEILDISVGTVKSRLYHARENLKVVLKNKTYEN